jgi:membrane fusion protein, multidrug efflux system
VKLKLVFALITLAAVASLCGCVTSASEPVNTPAPMAEPKTAAAMRSEPSTSATKVTGSGPLVVENQVDVLAQREGVITEIKADTGTVVRKGDLLATLDDRQLTADHASATAKAASIAADLKNWEALVKVAEVDNQRAEAMWKNSLITKQELDHQQYKLVAAKFEVDRERENLKQAVATADSLGLECEKAKIRAPFTGVVARRYVRAGQRIAPNERLFWVTATSPVRVRFTLPERLISEVHKGTDVEVTPTALGKPYAAKVVMLSPVVDPGSGTIEVTAELTAASEDLRPGMATTVRLSKLK